MRLVTALCDTMIGFRVGKEKKASIQIRLFIGSEARISTHGPSELSPLKSLLFLVVGDGDRYAPQVNRPRVDWGSSCMHHELKRNSQVGLHKRSAFLLMPS